ncbi:MAG: carbohydrate kinase family protein [Bacillota bacterium]
MYDVVALGELLIDFTPSGYSDNGNLLFERNPGGAPANVLAALAKLDRKTAFIGKAGNDQFGNFLLDVLKEAQIDTSGMVLSDEANTTLAFVHLKENGDRSFSFYRKPGADMLLREEEVDIQLIRNAKLFHFGSLSMTDEPAKTATLRAVEWAKEQGKLISYDPNLRPPLWDDMNHAKETMLHVMEYVDILKISEDELAFLADTEDIEKGSLLLHEWYEIPLILVTLGENGSFYRRGTDHGRVNGFEVNAVDTTGAGDAFLAGVINKVLEANKNIQEFSCDELKELLISGNALGALAAIKKGGIPAMPSKAEINEMIAQVCTA